MMPRQQWNDERLDHFENRVDERFDQIDERLDRMDSDIRELRVAVMGIHRVMLQGFIAMCTVMVGGFAAVFGAIAL